MFSGIKSPRRISLCQRFDHVNVNFVGPLPSSLGFTYHLTMEDHSMARVCSTDSCNDYWDGVGAHWDVGVLVWHLAWPFFRLGLTVYLRAQNCPRRGLPDFIAELGYGHPLWVQGISFRIPPPPGLQPTSGPSFMIKYGFLCPFLPPSNVFHSPTCLPVLQSTNCLHPPWCPPGPAAVSL